MTTFRITLHRGKSVVSRLIRWQTRGDYSHAGIILPDGRFFESREGKGVRSFNGWVANEGESVEFYAVQVNDQQAEEIISFLEAQLGKGYDWTMVLRFVTREQESRASTGKWFCSELVFAAFQQAGVNLLARTEPWEVSPGLLSRSTLLQRIDE